MQGESENEVAQSCRTLFDPMDCSLPCSSVHGIFQAIVLEWIAISFSKGSSWPRDQTQVPHIVDRRFYYLSHQGSLHHAGLDKAQAGIKIARRKSNNLRYADDTTLMAESEEELKSLLMNVEEESEKVGLKLNIQKTKIMASGPITSWQIDGKTKETVREFIFWAPKSLQMVISAMELKDTCSLEE